MRERGGDGGLGGFGHLEQRAARAGRRFEFGLAVHRGHQHGGVETQGVAGVGAPADPAFGDAACGGPHRGHPDQAVAVVDVVADLGGGQRQRHHGGQSHAFAGRHVGALHAAQRARPGGAARRLRLRLGFDQQRHDQAVVVGRDPRGLPVVVAQRQAQAAQLGAPGCGEFAAEPMTAGPNDAKHASKLPDGLLVRLA